jgi:competence protein ComEC
MLPLLIIYFHRVTPVSVVMNLWVGVVMAGESISAILGITISHFSSFLGEPFIVLAEFLNYMIATAPHKLVASSWASWRVPNYSGAASLIYVLYYFPVVGLAFALWHWDPFAVARQKIDLRAVRNTFGLDKTIASAAVIVALVGLLIVAHPLSSPRADRRLHIDFLDVGQGDSALITFPNGQTMLVDGGGRMEFRGDEEEDEEATFEPDRQGVGEAVVSPVLWQKGYSHIDYILATHADADHIQGLTDVAKNFSVGEALFGRMPAADPEFQELAAVLRDRGVPFDYVSRGQQLKFGGASVEVLYPRADRSTDAPSDNNHSVILRIVYGSRAFLLTGDIEREAETELVNGAGNLTADVIKVPHHGSRTSSTQEFVDKVGARYAVISVGRHSRFGHPHREVVDRWRASGAAVLTTGERGMVSVSTDGSELRISSFLNLPK